MRGRRRGSSRSWGMTRSLSSTGLPTPGISSWPVLLPPSSLTAASADHALPRGLFLAHGRQALSTLSPPATLQPFGDLYYRFHKGPDIVRLFIVLQGHRGEIRRHRRHDRALLRRRLEEGRLGRRGTTFSRSRTIFSSFSQRKRPRVLSRDGASMRAGWCGGTRSISVCGVFATSDLVVPLDANIFKIGRCLGWTEQKTQSWKAACQITEELKKHCPEDPLKYDFFLCHVVGIGGGCTGVRNGDCAKGVCSMKYRIVSLGAPRTSSIRNIWPEGWKGRATARGRRGSGRREYLRVHRGRVQRIDRDHTGGSAKKAAAGPSSWWQAASSTATGRNWPGFCRKSTFSWGRTPAAASSAS